MQAVILAAGLGSRLRPYTNKVPKAMVKFKGREIIVHQIETLREVGIKNIIIVTGYKLEILEKHLSNKFDNFPLVMIFPAFRIIISPHMFSISFKL